MNKVTDAALWVIRTNYLGDDAELRDIAYKWLCNLIGLKDANANLFILTFYKDWDDDSSIVIDDKNHWGMHFKTYRIAFGKDYRYTVTMNASFGGIEIVKEEMDYSRWDVGNGKPKWDFCDMLCRAFRKSGYTFYNGLFANANHQIKN